MTFKYGKWKFKLIGLVFLFFMEGRGGREGVTRSYRNPFMRGVKFLIILIIKWFLPFYLRKEGRTRREILLVRVFGSWENCREREKEERKTESP